MKMPPHAPAQNQHLVTLDIHLIEPDPTQDRKHFDDRELAELAESIREHGVTQPITVRPLRDGRFRIHTGERRWRASQLAGLATIPTIIDTAERSDEDLHARQLIENLQRADLSLPEQMAGIARMVDAIGGAATARAVGKDPAWVSRVAGLRGIWPLAHQLVVDGLIISPDVAHELHRLANGGPKALASAETLVGYFRHPPAHRLHPPTREEIRDALRVHDAARKAEAELAQAQTARARREIAADNRRGYDSPADDTPTPRAATTGIDKAAEVRAQAQRLAADEAERAERAQAREEKRDQRERLLATCLGFTRLDNGTHAPRYLWDDAEVELHLEAHEHGGEVTYTFSLDGLSALDVERLAEHLSQRRTAPPPPPALPAGSSDAELAQVRQFLATHTRPSPGDHIAAGWLQDLFADWSRAQGIAAIPRPRVAALIEATGIRVKRLETGKTYRDITPATASVSALSEETQP